MSPTFLFRTSAAGALLLHAAILLGRSGLHGGGDLTPHLRLIQLMGETPALRSVYAPAYHVLGALIAPIVGLEAYPQWFGWLSAAALIAGFRFFQRAAGLPDACSAVFAWAPYGFALSACLPKVEAAGYALALVGLGLVLLRRPWALAATLAATFAVHTAAALLLGLCGGVLALARRDQRAVVALAGGTLLASPLLLAHLAAGCSLPEALLFSQGDYLRAAPRAEHWRHLDRVLVLANPLALVLGVAGARGLWERQRPLAILCAVLTFVYLNEAWLAPFGARTTLDLVRGLTVFAIPVACAAGVWLAAAPRPERATLAAVAVSAATALAATLWVVPDTCVSNPLDVIRVERFEVDRCVFRWYRRGPVSGARPGSGGGAELPEIALDLGVERTAHHEGAPQ